MQPATNEKTFHLRWNNHLQNLSQLFTTIYSSAALADVTLSCRDGTIKAHKLVLSACSPYFEQIFKENPCKHPVIILKGIPYSEINLLVEFMYKGSVDVQEMDLQSLMHTASELEIRGLAYEVRKDASQLLNINLEYPSYSSTPTTQTQYNASPSNYEASPRSVSSAAQAFQTDMERLRQIHLYQQSMCRNTPYSQVSQQNNANLSQMNPELVKKRRKDEPMAPTTTSAVKTILAAAAKEMAETHNGDPKEKVTACIQTEDECNDTKDEMESTDSDDKSEASHTINDDEEPLHNRDTRFKGKKRVSVGMQEDYESQLDSQNKLVKKKVRFGSKSPKSSEDGGSTSGAGEMSIKPNMIFSGADTNNSVNQHKSIIKVVNISHLQHRNEDPKPMGGTSINYPTEAETSYISDNDDYESDVSYKGTEGGPSEIDKMHKCDMCDARFCYVTVLEKHRMKHRMQQCGSCGMTFVDADKYKKHMRVCERDDPTVRDPDESRRKEQQNMLNIPQNAIIPGMVSIGHSERSTLMFTPSGDVMLAPRSEMSMNMSSSDMSPNVSSNVSMNMSSDRSMMEDGMIRIDGIDHPIKRGRGRPRKTPLPLIPKIKRKRGRPPKYWSTDGSMHPGPKENYNAANLPFGDFSYLTEMMYNQPSIAEGFHHPMHNMDSGQSMNMHRNTYQPRNPAIVKELNVTENNKSDAMSKQYALSNPVRSMPINYSTGPNNATEPLIINKVTEDAHVIQVELKKSDESSKQTTAVSVDNNYQPNQSQPAMIVGDCQIITTNTNENGNQPEITTTIESFETEPEKTVNSISVTKIGDCTIERITENT